MVKLAIHKNIIVNDSLYGFEYDDLYQEGCIWLCKAAVSFDETRNIKFSTYAERIVINGLRTYCRLMCGKQKHHIVIPIQKEQDLSLIHIWLILNRANRLKRLLPNLGHQNRSRAILRIRLLLKPSLSKAFPKRTMTAS